MEETDERGPQRDTGNKTFGAVDRVEHPNPFGIGTVAAVLLANDAVVREAAHDHLPHEFFGAAICRRHG